MIGSIIATIAFVIVTVVMSACVIAGIVDTDAAEEPQHLCRV